jgi:hypothetical protein
VEAEIVRDLTKKQIKEVAAAKENLEKMFQNISEQIKATGKEVKMEDTGNSAGKDGSTVEAVDKNEVHATHVVPPETPNPPEPPHNGGNGGGDGNSGSGSKGDGRGGSDDNDNTCQKATSTASSAKKLAFFAIGIAVIAVFLALVLFISKVGKNEFAELQATVSEQATTVSTLATNASETKSLLAAITEKVITITGAATQAVTVADDAKKIAAEALEKSKAAKTSSVNAQRKANAALEGVKALKKQLITQQVVPEQQFQPQKGATAQCTQHQTTQQCCVRARVDGRLGCFSPEYLQTLKRVP